MSPNTVASYRDAMLLFLDFAHERLGKVPTELRLSLQDIRARFDPGLSSINLEQQRNNTVRKAATYA